MDCTEDAQPVRHLGFWPPEVGGFLSSNPSLGPPSEVFFFLPYFQVPRNDLKGFSSFWAVFFPRVCPPTVCSRAHTRVKAQGGEKEHALTSHLGFPPSLVLGRRWRTGAPILGREPIRALHRRHNDTVVTVVPTLRERAAWLVREDELILDDLRVLRSPRRRRQGEKRQEVEEDKGKTKGRSIG